MARLQAHNSFRDVQRDLFVLPLLLVTIHLHASKLLEAELCVSQTRRQGPNEYCDSGADFFTKAEYLANNYVQLWSLSGEVYIVAAALMLIAWIAAALAAVWSDRMRAAYNGWLRTWFAICTKLVAKLVTIAYLAFWRDLPPSSYCTWYLPLDGAMVIWQAYMTPVGGTGQVVLAATNAACTFVICFLLSDRWPFQHLSTGTLLATNLLLAYASVLLAQRLEAAEKLEQAAAASAHPPSPAGGSGAAAPGEPSSSGACPLGGSAAAGDGGSSSAGGAGSAQAPALTGAAAGTGQPYRHHEAGPSGSAGGAYTHGASSAAGGSIGRDEGPTAVAQRNQPGATVLEHRSSPVVVASADEITPSPVSSNSTTVSADSASAAPALPATAAAAAATPPPAAHVGDTPLMTEALVRCGDSPFSSGNSCVMEASLCLGMAASPGAGSRFGTTGGSAFSAAAACGDALGDSASIAIGSCGLSSAATDAIGDAPTALATPPAPVCARASSSPLAPTPQPAQTWQACAAVDTAASSPAAREQAVAQVGQGAGGGAGGGGLLAGVASIAAAAARATCVVMDTRRRSASCATARVQPVSTGGMIIAALHAQASASASVSASASASGNLAAAAAAACASGAARLGVPASTGGDSELCSPTPGLTTQSMCRTMSRGLSRGLEAPSFSTTSVSSCCGFAPSSLRATSALTSIMSEATSAGVGLGPGSHPISGASVAGSNAGGGCNSAAGVSGCARLHGAMCSADTAHLASSSGIVPSAAAAPATGTAGVSTTDTGLAVLPVVAAPLLAAVPPTATSALPSPATHAVYTARVSGDAVGCAEGAACHAAGGALPLAMPPAAAATVLPAPPSPNTGLTAGSSDAGVGSGGVSACPSASTADACSSSHAQHGAEASGPSSQAGSSATASATMTLRLCSYRSSIANPNSHALDGAAGPDLASLSASAGGRGSPVADAGAAEAGAAAAAAVPTASPALAAATSDTAATVPGRRSRRAVQAPTEAEAVRCCCCAACCCPAGACGCGPSADVCRITQVLPDHVAAAARARATSTASTSTESMRQLSAAGDATGSTGGLPPAAVLLMASDQGFISGATSGAGGFSEGAIAAAMGGAGFLGAEPASAEQLVALERAARQALSADQLSSLTGGRSSAATMQALVTNAAAAMAAAGSAAAEEEDYGPASLHGPGPCSCGCDRSAAASVVAPVAAVAAEARAAAVVQGPPSCGVEAPAAPSPQEAEARVVAAGQDADLQAAAKPQGENGEGGKMEEEKEDAPAPAEGAAAAAPLQVLTSPAASSDGRPSAGSGYGLAHLPSQHQLLPPPPPPQQQQGVAPGIFALARALAARGGAGAVYESPALVHLRCSVKVNGLTPADLPSNLAGRVGSYLASGAAAAGGGAAPLAAVGVYVREGCVEIVADVLIPASSAANAEAMVAVLAASMRGSGGGAGAAAGGGAAPADGAAGGLPLPLPAPPRAGQQPRQRRSSQHAAAAAMLDLLERRLLPELTGGAGGGGGGLTLPDGDHVIALQAAAGAGAPNAASAGLSLSVRAGGAPGAQQSVLQAPLRPPTAAAAEHNSAPPLAITCVSPCCISLVQSGADDTRDCRAAAVTLLVTLGGPAVAAAAASAGTDEAGLPRLLVRHGGRCLPVGVRRAPSLFPGCLTLAVTLPLTGVRPGCLFLEAAPSAAAAIDAAGAVDSGSLSLPWPVLVAGDARVAAEVMSLQAQLVAAAPLRALAAELAAVRPGSAQQQPNVDGGTLAMLLDLGMWFEAVSAPEAAMQAAAVAAAAVAAATGHAAHRGLSPPRSHGRSAAEASAQPTLPAPAAAASTTASAAPQPAASAAAGMAPQRVAADPMEVDGGAGPGGNDSEDGGSGWASSEEEEEPEAGAGANQAAANSGVSNAAAAAAAAAAPAVQRASDLDQDVPEPPAPAPAPAGGGAALQAVASPLRTAAQVGSGAVISTEDIADDVGAHVDDDGHDGGAEAQMALLRARSTAPPPAHLSALAPPQPPQLLAGSLDCGDEYEAMCRRSAALQSAAAGLGLRLLRFAISRGWPAASTLLLKGLMVHCRLSFADVVALFPASGSLPAAPAAAAVAAPGLPLLHAAVTSGKLSMVRAVAAWGQRYCVPLRWDEPAAAAGGLTPLHLAAVLEDHGRLAGSLLGLFPEAEAVWGVARDADGHTPQDYAYMRAFNFGAASAAASNGADSAAASGSAGAASASSWPRADATTAAISSVPVPIGSGGGGGGGGSALAPLLAASNAISGPSAPTQALAMAPALQPLGAAVSPMHLAGGARWQQLLPAQQQQQQQQQQPAQQQAPAQQPTELDAVSGGTPRAIRGAVAAAVAAAGGRGASGAGFHAVQYYRDFDGGSEDCGSMSAGPESLWSHSTNATHHTQQYSMQAHPQLLVGDMLMLSVGGGGGGTGAGSNGAAVAAGYSQPNIPSLQAVPELPPLHQHNHTSGGRPNIADAAAVAGTAASAVERYCQQQQQGQPHQQYQQHQVQRASGFAAQPPNGSAANADVTSSSTGTGTGPTATTTTCAAAAQAVLTLVDLPDGATMLPPLPELGPSSFTSVTLGPSVSGAAPHGPGAVRVTGAATRQLQQLLLCTRNGGGGEVSETLSLGLGGSVLLGPGGGACSQLPVVAEGGSGACVPTSSTNLAHLPPSLLAMAPAAAQAQAQQPQYQLQPGDAGGGGVEGLEGGDRAGARPASSVGMAALAGARQVRSAGRRHSQPHQQQLLQMAAHMQNQSLRRQQQQQQQPAASAAAARLPDHTPGQVPPLRRRQPPGRRGSASAVASGHGGVSVSRGASAPQHSTAGLMPLVTVASGAATAPGSTNASGSGSAGGFEAAAAVAASERTVRFAPSVTASACGASESISTFNPGTSTACSPYQTLAPSVDASGGGGCGGQLQPLRPPSAMVTAAVAAALSALAAGAAAAGASGAQNAAAVSVRVGAPAARLSGGSSDGRFSANCRRNAYAADYAPLSGVAREGSGRAQLAAAAAPATAAAEVAAPAVAVTAPAKLPPSLMAAPAAAGTAPGSVGRSAEALPTAGGAAGAAEWPASAVGQSSLRAPSVGTAAAAVALASSAAAALPLQKGAFEWLSVAAGGKPAAGSPTADDRAVQLAVPAQGAGPEASVAAGASADEGQAWVAVECAPVAVADAHAAEPSSDPAALALERSQDKLKLKGIEVNKFREVAGAEPGRPGVAAKAMADCSVAAASQTVSVPLPVKWLFALAVLLVALLLRLLLGAVTIGV